MEPAPAQPPASAAPTAPATPEVQFTARVYADLQDGSPEERALYNRSREALETAAQLGTINGAPLRLSHSELYDDIAGVPTYPGTRITRTYLGKDGAMYVDGVITPKTPHDARLVDDIRSGALRGVSLSECAVDNATATQGARLWVPFKLVVTRTPARPGTSCRY